MDRTSARTARRHVPDQAPSTRAPGAGHIGGRRPGDPHLAASAIDLTRTYGDGEAAVTALDSVSVGIDSGALTAIMGPSGSGKSTLMHLLAGLDTPTSGRVLLGDVELTRLNDTALTKTRRERVGFVFQAFNLVPTLSAEENILLPLRLAGRRGDPDWIAEVVTRLGIGDRMSHRPGQLSGGQQQRVALGRALVSRPEVIFADEPTGALDSRTGAEVLALLRRSVDDWGQLVVMVTHDPIAAAYADRVILLSDGRLAGDLTAPRIDDVIDAVRTLGGPPVAGAPSTTSSQVQP